MTILRPFPGWLLPLGICWLSLVQVGPIPPQFARQVAPGVQHLQITRGFESPDESTGPWSINLLRVDPALCELRVAHALDETIGLEAISSIAARHGAIAAINGGYFRMSGTYRGDPAGVYVANGQLLSEPREPRAAVGFRERNGKTELIFGRLGFAGIIRAGRESHPVAGVNCPRSENDLVIYTPEFHRTTLTTPGGVEVIVRRGQVVARRDRMGSSVIPDGGFVVSASGASREWVLKQLRPGLRVGLRLELVPAEAASKLLWGTARYIIGGGPQLLRGAW